MRQGDFTFTRIEPPPLPADAVELVELQEDELEDDDLEVVDVELLGPPPAPRPPPLPKEAPRRREPGDRRGSPRRALQLKVHVVPLLNETGLPSCGHLRQGLTLDLSEAGLLCARLGYLPVGSLVRVFVSLPDSRGALSCMARVVRPVLLRSPCYGLKLIGLGPADTARLRQLLPKPRSPGVLRAA